jgi:DNA polymerase I-like protein with 3'-5' exonuclease and polymerase domains
VWEHIIFDAETDGLLPEATVMHSLVLRDLQSNEVLSCADQPGYFPIEQGLETLQRAEKVYAHNAIKFDHPVIEKLYPGWYCNRDQIVDTLVAVRLVFAHQKDLDYELMRRGKLAGNQIGLHNLDAWGQRLGLHKWKYEGGWEEWSKEMQEYCEQDTIVCRAIVERVRAQGFSKQAMDLEHELAWYLAEQERRGVVFDLQAAQELVAKLAPMRLELDTKLRKQFGSWLVAGKLFTPKRDNKARGYVEGAEFQRLQKLEFNPQSRDHIADRLQKLYGWQPEKFTKTGKPEINEGTLKGLERIPETEDLRQYLLLNKRLGQISEGKQAWLKCVVKSPDGLHRIHGAINPNGTPTGRGIHSHPNLGQVPRVKSPYGQECRGLFTVPPGWKLLGSDASGLELRMLGHYLAKYDNGEYVKTLLEADIHEAVRLALGIETRDKSKTISYALIYGAGNAKLGRIIDPSLSDDAAAKKGKYIRSDYERGIQGWKYLNDAVKHAAKTKSKLRGLDGRAIYVRAEHAALNYLLQGAGSIVVKTWIVRFARELTEKLGPPGELWYPVLWVHDEVQLAVRPEVADQVKEIVVNAMPPVGDHYELRCPVAADAKVGETWAQTH